MNTEKELHSLSVGITQAKRFLKNAPEGNIQHSTSNGSNQYYAVTCDNKRTYLSKTQSKELAKYAQKQYAKKFLKAAEILKQKLTKFLNSYDQNACTQVYEKLNFDLKQYVHPYILTNKQFAEKWANEDYTTKGIKDGERFYTTENGEKVRSKSELTIANKLYIKGIKYRYEQAHYMKGFGTVYPDFTILNPQTREEIIWEHFGLMDNPEYVQNSLKKLQTYADNGIVPGHGLIVTYESNTTPLDTKTLEAIIETFF